MTGRVRDRSRGKWTPYVLALLALAFAALDWLTFPPALPSYAAVRAAWRPSEAWLYDRHGALIDSSRVDFAVRRLAWTPLDRIAPSLPLAVVAAEDARFCGHHGFDWAAMRAAAERNAEGGRTRGGSTLSQQTAKNVFLWPHRDYVRKGLEAGYTALIEALWGKRRILEVYLNVVEWGPGVYGAEAAAQRWFGVDADRLTPAQADRLAAILPSPLKWRAAQPGRYVARRSRRIGANARVVRADDLLACVRR